MQQVSQLEASAASLRREADAVGDETHPRVVEARRVLAHIDGVVRATSPRVEIRRVPRLSRGRTVTTRYRDEGDRMVPIVEHTPDAAPADIAAAVEAVR
jgi:hypothetical protein